MSSKSKANCSASMVAATVGRAGSSNPLDSGASCDAITSSSSEAPFPFVESGSVETDVSSDSVPTPVMESSTKSTSDVMPSEASSDPDSARTVSVASDSTGMSSGVTMVTGSTSNSLLMFPRRCSRSLSDGSFRASVVFPASERISEICCAASSSRRFTAPSGMPRSEDSDANTICGPLLSTGSGSFLSDAAAADVEGVVPKESQESGLSKMPSLIRVSSFHVILGPSWTRPSSSNQSSR